MKGLLASLAGIMHLAYSSMLISIGASGVILARWELAAIFAVDTNTMTRSDAATMLNQYRFLKSVELGAGIYSLILRQRILSGGKEAYAFLALVAAGVIARASVFVGFLVAEIATFVCVAIPLLFSPMGDRS